MKQQTIHMKPISELIIRDGFNCRQDFSDIEDFAETKINSVGYVQDPIILNAKNEVVSGERRTRACLYLQSLGVETHNMEHLSESGEILVPVTYLPENTSYSKEVELMMISGAGKPYQTLENAFLWKSTRDIYVQKHGRENLGEISKLAGVSPSTGTKINRFWKLFDNHENLSDLPEHLQDVPNQVMEKLKNKEISFDAVQKLMKTDEPTTEDFTGYLDQIHELLETSNSVVEVKTKKFSKKGYQKTIETAQEFGISPEFIIFAEAVLKYSTGEFDDEQFQTAIEEVKNYG